MMEEDSLSDCSQQTLLESKFDDSLLQSESEDEITLRKNALSFVKSVGNKDELDNSALFDKEKKRAEALKVKTDNSSSSNSDASSKPKDKELHRQKMERYRLAEKRIGKYSKQKNLCDWEQKRFDSAKAVMKDKALVEYVQAAKNKVKLAKSSDALQTAMKGIALKDNPGISGEDGKDNNKRNRSDDSIEETTTKKPKSDLAEFHVYLVNEGIQGGRISPELWQKIEAHLTDLFLEELEKEHPIVDIQFYGAGNKSGHKYLVCCNQETVKWMEENIGKIKNLGENVKLKCFSDKGRLNQFETPKCWVWIPKPYYEEEKVLRLLKCQNRDIDTSSWKILKSGPKRTHGQHFLIEISKDCLKDLDKVNGYVKFSVSRVVVKPTRNFEIEDKVPTTDGIAAN